MVVRRFARSLSFALRGIAFGLRTEPHLRAHLVIAALVVAAGFWLGITPQQWTVIALCTALVVACELINTAVERAVDLVTPDYHPLAEAAKNAAAGAVLVAVAGAVVCGLIILGPALWEFIVDN